MSDQVPSPLGEVARSAKAYSDATTALSQTIVELEQFLQSLPAKREVRVIASQASGEGVSFARRRDGKWCLQHELGEMSTLAALLAQSNKPWDPCPPLRDASVTDKLKLAPLLPQLLKKLASEMNAEAEVASSATAQVKQLLGALRGQGGR